MAEPVCPRAVRSGREFGHAAAAVSVADLVLRRASHACQTAKCPADMLSMMPCTVTPGSASMLTIVARTFRRNSGSCSEDPSDRECDDGLCIVDALCDRRYRLPERRLT